MIHDGSCRTVDAWDVEAFYEFTTGYRLFFRGSQV
jgi:hypothetical protein